MKKITPMLLVISLLIPLFVFSGCFSDDGRNAELKITYLNDGKREERNYSCRSQGCDVLNNIIWRPVLPGELCPEGYGGTDLVIIRGEVNGQDVDTKFQRTNMCEIARFDSLNELLRYNSLLGGKKEGIQTASHYLNLTNLSHTIAGKLPFVAMPWITALVLFLFLLLSYLWLSAIKLSWQRSRLRLITLILVPWSVVYYLYQLVTGRAKAKLDFLILMESSIILATLFLPLPVTIAVTAIVISLLIKRSKENKNGKVGNESQKDEDKKRL